MRMSYAVQAYRRQRSIYYLEWTIDVHINLSAEATCDPSCSTWSALLWPSWRILVNKKRCSARQYQTVADLQDFRCAVAQWIVWFPNVGLIGRQCTSAPSAGRGCVLTQRTLPSGAKCSCSAYSLLPRYPVSILLISVDLYDLKTYF